MKSGVADLILRQPRPPCGIRETLLDHPRAPVSLPPLRHPHDLPTRSWSFPQRSHLAPSPRRHTVCRTTDVIPLTSHVELAHHHLCNPREDNVRRPAPPRPPDRLVTEPSRFYLFIIDNIRQQCSLSDTLGRLQRYLP